MVSQQPPRGLSPANPGGPRPRVAMATRGVGAGFVPASGEWLPPRGLLWAALSAPALGVQVSSAPPLTGKVLLPVDNFEGLPFVCGVAVHLVSEICCH